MRKHKIFEAMQNWVRAFEMVMLYFQATRRYCKLLATERQELKKMIASVLLFIVTILRLFKTNEDFKTHVRTNFVFKRPLSSNSL